MIFHTNNKQTQEYILPILAIALSIGSLTSTYNLSNIASLLISLVGITAGILFFLNNKYFSILIQVWIYGQFPAITKTTSTLLENGIQSITEYHILDAGQMFKQTFGLSLGTSSGEINLYVNIIPIAFIVLFKLFQASKLIGMPVTITQFRQENNFGDVFPLNGIILKNININKEKNWVLAELEKEFTYNTLPYKYLLLRSKDGQMYKSGKTKFISYVRLVNDPSLIRERIENTDNYPFVDWGTVSVGS